MRAKTLLLVAGFSLLVAGCGGGGGASSSNDALPSIPPSHNSGGTTITPPVTDPDTGEPVPPPVTNGEIKITAAVGAAGLPYHYQIPWPEMPADVTYKATDLPAWASVDANGAIVGTADNADAWIPIEVVAASADKTITATGHMVVKYPGSFAKSEKIDFYDKPFDGHNRDYRKDLVGGDLQGSVFFVQTHSVAPEHSENEIINKEDQTKSQYMPDIIALRGALLVFIPAKGTDPVTVGVNVSAPGKALKTLAMAPPAQLPIPDRTTQLTFSTRAWSVVLPWDDMVNGLSLEFEVDAGAPDAKRGSLPASKIDIDRATRLEFQNVLLGMLTYPPTKQPYYTYDDPISAATDYFQTMPVSKLVIGNYAPMQLDRAIVNRTYDVDGDPATKGDRYTAAKVYDVNSDNPADHSSDSTNASVYSGDMRENVNKSQVSVGIDLANMGISSWDLTQGYPKSIKIITNTHVYGEYKCTGRDKCPESGHWRVEHGLSGGNGIGTITNTWGNEASHEWGHAYGLGHWPGSGLTDDCRWTDQNPMTGWGYIAYRDRMRNSVYGIAQGKEEREMCSPGHANLVYQKGDFMYSRDAMSGGNYGGSPMSNYTFYSSFSARLIQNDMDKWYIPDADYATGYKQWDNDSGDWAEVAEPTLDGDLAPVVQETGVAVATLLGGYDPNYLLYEKAPTKDIKHAVIYPVFHGNYGSLFDLPAPSTDTAVDACWVDVSSAAGTNQLVAIKATRNRGGSINQFHFNLPASFQPTAAALKCRHNGTTRTLDSRTFDPAIPELPPVAIVGQEAGFEQMQARDMKAIEQGIMALAPDHIANMDYKLTEKIDSYSDAQLQASLSPASWGYLKQFRQLQQAGNNIAALVGYTKALGLDSTATRSRLSDYLVSTKLMDASEQLTLTGGPLLSRNGPYAAPRTSYLSTQPDANNRLPIVKDIKDADQHQWVMDTQGKLHPVDQPDQCLVATGALSIASCNPMASNQRWTWTEKEMLKAANGQCIDIHSTAWYAETYSCHGGWNQTWFDVKKTDALWLSLLDGNTIKQIRSIITP